MIDLLTNIWRDAKRKPWKVYLTLAFIFLILRMLEIHEPVHRFFVPPETPHIKGPLEKIYGWLILADALLLFTVSVLILDNYERIARDLDRLQPARAPIVWVRYRLDSHSLWCAVAVFFAMIFLTWNLILSYVALMALIYAIFCSTNLALMAILLDHRDQIELSDERDRQFALMVLKQTRVFEEENQMAFRAYAVLYLVMAVLLYIYTAVPDTASLELDGLARSVQEERHLGAKLVVKAFGAGAAIVHFFVASLSYAKYYYADSTVFGAETSERGMLDRVFGMLSFAQPSASARAVPALFDDIERVRVHAGNFKTYAWLLLIVVGFQLILQTTLR
jgi:hypothetical protein